MSALPEYLANLDPFELYQDCLDFAQDSLSTITAWQPGEPARGLFDVVSRAFASVWNAQALPAIRARFWDSAPDDDALTVDVWTSTGTLRKSSTFASVRLVVVNQGGGVYTPIQPGQIRVRNGNNKTFTNVDAGNLAAWSGSGPYPTVPLTFRADEPGSSSNTAVSGIDTNPVTAPGAGVAVQTNAVEAIGQDREAKAALLERARAAPSVASVAGPRRAYEMVITSTRRPNGVEPERMLVSQETDVAVPVNRVAIENLGGGVINVWLADPSGPAQGSSALVDSDVWLVARALRELVIPDGLAATIAPAVALAPSYSLELVLDPASKVSPADAVARAQASLQAWQRTFPIGGRAILLSRYVTLDEVRRQAALELQDDGTYRPAPGIASVAVITGADVTMGANNVLVGSYTITATVGGL